MTFTRLILNLLPLIILQFILSLPFGVVAQQSISGSIVDDETGKPVPFASITRQNKPNGTVSDENGFFSIDCDKESILVISHINYKKKALPIKNLAGQKTIKIRVLPKSEMLSDVVVSASLYEQPMQKLSRSVVVLGHKQIIDEIHSNIIDVVASMPGFTQVWEYHSPIILRGLNGTRIVILKDGARKIGTFPGGYFGQDMNMYDIDKVEVVKGPGSVIYGSGAISGIINVISKEPFGHRGTGAKILSGYGSNNNEFLEAINAHHSGDKFGIAVNAKFRTADEFIYGNGETAENSDVEDRDLSLNAGYKFNHKHKIIVNAAYHMGDWGKPRGFNGDDKYFTRIRNNEESYNSSLNYTWSPGGIVDKVQFTTFYEQGTRDYYQYKYNIFTWNLSELNLVHYANNYGGYRLFSLLNITEKNRLTFGADGYVFLLDNPGELFDYNTPSHGNIDGLTDAGEHNIGFFISDNWSFNQKWRLESGLRYDFAEVYQGNINDSVGVHKNKEAWSGSLGLVYSPTEYANLSLNIGRAFRMPFSDELFTRKITCQGTLIGNPDLNPEYSTSIDVGWRGTTNNEKLKYDLALFYNRIGDFSKKVLHPDDDIDFTFANTDAELFGGELMASYRFDNVFAQSNCLYLGAGAAYVYGKDFLDDSIAPLFGMPPYDLKVDVNYRGQLNKVWITGYNLKITTKYAAEQSRVPVLHDGESAGPWGYYPSDPNLTFNVQLGVNSNSLPGHPKLRFVVNNLFDVDYKPYGSNVPAMGRNFKIALKFNI